ncbi:D-glycero-alpha-D-manno-heptose-1,7-bisphosphate 7-phosphatase [Paenibacillus guangzhouensis]|uniref:D-glycero-alpha-D-manno-heptose-1,7-bisphosphate 7-phosphatase n=1 Tax=Paenibacillus guangzhouensis TaxID=1473112 RepID=UPI001266F44F|nr:HAD family hydrolase [Paenibacillus guangzhouensis]
MNKAVFFDRDGVINVEKNYVYKIEDFEFVDGIFDVMKHFQSLGYLLIVITNQAGIGRGYYSEEDFHKLNDWMIERFKVEGIEITKVYYSPYHPEHGIGEYKKDSWCRKPNPGMILQAKDDFDIDLRESILFGDKDSDIEAGIRAEVGENVLVQMNVKINANK